MDVIQEKIFWSFFSALVYSYTCILFPDLQQKTPDVCHFRRKVDQGDLATAQSLVLPKGTEVAAHSKLYKLLLQFGTCFELQHKTTEVLDFFFFFFLLRISTEYLQI